MDVYLTFEERLERKRQTEALANEITEFAGHLNAANYRFLKLIAEEIFPHVASNPLVLCNTNNAPMFALFFAAAHPKYGATAMKIAQDVLRA